jgi:hypothetical protein
VIKLQFTPSPAPYEPSKPCPIAVRNMKIVDAMQPWLKAKVHEIGLSDTASKHRKAYEAAKRAAKLTRKERGGVFRQRAMHPKALAKLLPSVPAMVA